MPECYNHQNHHLSQLVQQYQEFLLNISWVDNCLPLNIKVTHLLSSNTKFHSYQVTHCLLFKIKMSHSYKNFFKQNYHTQVYFKNLELSVYDSRIDIVTNLYRTSGGVWSPCHPPSWIHYWVPTPHPVASWDITCFSNKQFSSKSEPCILK